MVSKKEAGLLGEDMAVDYLEKEGYRILCRNFRRKFAEIDIVAQQGETLCFVEVKARSVTDFGLPCEAVHAEKQAKIRRLAELFIQSYDIDYEEIRFDIIEIYLKDGHIHHMEDAF